MLIDEVCPAYAMYCSDYLVTYRPLGPQGQSDRHSRQLLSGCYHRHVLTVACKSVQAWLVAGLCRARVWTSQQHSSGAVVP